MRRVSDRLSVGALLERGHRCLPASLPDSEEAVLRDGILFGGLPAP